MKRTVFLFGAIIFLMSAVSIWASEREERVFRVSGPASLTLSNTSGNITIKISQGNEVRVVSYKSEDAEMDVRQSGDAIRIETRKGELDYEIALPPNSNVDVRSVSGDLSITGPVANVDAMTTSGALHIEEVKGRLMAKTVSGNLTLRRCEGDLVTVNSVSGDLVLDGVRGRVDGKSVSGNIRFSNAHGTKLNLLTTSGDVVYEGQLVKNGSYTLSSHSGNIRVLLPGDSSFEVTAHSFSGEIESEFPLKLSNGGITKRSGKAPLHATYGGGDAALELKTFSGDIRIKKSSASPMR